jgi:23S rRNA (adenine2503-C2)-methyltransferase
MSAPVDHRAPSRDLRALSHGDLVGFVRDELGEAQYRADQIFQWVHARGATAFDDMTNLSKPLRARLAERASLGTLSVDRVQCSADGTRKLRLVTRDGEAIESVLIPDGDKLTQCISSQVGCALDCKFCATATMGLHRNLDAGEIADQVYRARAVLAGEEPGRRITNLVYMGMGEPLHNYAQVVKSFAILTDERGANLSHRRITVSTVGLVPGIEKLGREPLQVNLAISLNAADDDTRARIMPVNKKYPIAALLDAVRAYPLERRRRVTFEYVLLAGVNDSPDDARRLARLLADVRSKVNLIPLNAAAGIPFERPSDHAVDRFAKILAERGVTVSVRKSRGRDIRAACGQLIVGGSPHAPGPRLATIAFAD